MAAAFGQPVRQACDFAFAERGHALNLAVVPAVSACLQFDRQKVFKTQSLRDGAGDKFVGGGNQHQGIACVAVLLQKRQGLWRDGWGNHFRHKTAVRR